MKFKTPVNENYAATVVRLKNFVELDNCDNVKSALIFGNSVIVSKDCQVGDVGLFFPVECQLSKEFLGQNNLFRKPEFGNIDPEKTGFFEHHGRVKAVKFRGHKSEGFWIPLHSVEYTGIQDEFKDGLTFDFIGDHEICRKYVIKKHVQNPTRGKKAVDLAKYITDGQFRFHFDTTNLRKNIKEIRPNDLISITDKWHGTSAVYANVLIKRKLNIIEWLLKKLGVKIKDTKYGLVYSSRRGIRFVDKIRTKSKEYIDAFNLENIWGVVGNEVGSKIPKGFTVYGEIVGYLPSGMPIQGKFRYGNDFDKKTNGIGNYHYGCQVGEHRFLVYRVTTTNEDGQVVELPFPQMKEFCVRNGLEHVKEFYYGYAEALVKSKNYVCDEEWQEQLLLSLEKEYVHDQMCSYNHNEVPAEGIVVRKDELNECKSFKLKNFKFLEWESKQLDSGQVDIESSQE